MNVVFDVTGYFIQKTDGASYVPVTPTRLVDSRPGPSRQGLTASLVFNSPARFTVTGGVIPGGAVAVTGNLTAVSNGANGYFSLTPDQPAGIPSTSTLNFPAGDIRANAVTVRLGGDGGLWITFMGVGGSMDAVFDVSGYYSMG